MGNGKWEKWKYFYIITLINTFYFPSNIEYGRYSLCALLFRGYVGNEIPQQAVTYCRDATTLMARIRGLLL